MIKARAYVGTRTDKRGKERIVIVHIDKGYVWDKLFEAYEERHGHNTTLDGTRTRDEARKIIKADGYRVRRGEVTVKT